MPKKKPQAEVPDPPELLRISEVSARYLKISWNRPPLSRSLEPLANIISQYELIFKKESDQHATKKLLPGEVTEFVMAPLAPCEKVSQISIAACNFVGWGKHTLWKLDGKSNPDIPSVPLNLRLEWAGETSLTLAWDLPLEINGDDVRKYELHLWYEGGLEFKIMVEAPALKYTFDDLEHGMIGYSKIRAANIAGWSDWSDTLEVVTNTGPPRAPNLLAISNVTSSSCLISFSPPKGVNDIITYRIKVQLEGFPPFFTEKNGDERSALVEDLKSMWPFSIHIQGINAKGPGEWGGGGEIGSCQTYATVWTWGGNEEGQLGRGSNGATLEEHIANQQKKLSRQRRFRLKHPPISSRPPPLPPPRPVISLSEKNVLFCGVGTMHSVCVTSFGAVFCWGSNQFGQLGHPRKEMRWSPNAIKVPVKSEIVDLQLQGRMVSQGLPEISSFVCCGRNSTYVIAENQLYTFGSGMNGVLGQGDERNIDEPAIVEAIRGKKVTDIVSGDSHILLVADNQLYSCGLGVNGQLGTGQTQSTTVPVLINLPASPISIAAGQSHSACVVRGGVVFTWGFGRDGRLGIGTDESTTLPTPILWFVERGIRIKKISCGWYHTLALSSSPRPGVLYAWGNGSCGQLGIGQPPPPNGPVSYLGERRGEVKVRLPREIPPWRVGGKMRIAKERIDPKCSPQLVDDIFEAEKEKKSSVDDDLATKIESLEDALEEIQWICCGPTSSLAGSNSEAYGWGEAQGILQNLDPEEGGGGRVFEPQRLREGLQARVRSIAVGEKHVVLCGGCAWEQGHSVDNSEEIQEESSDEETEKD